MPHGLQGGRPPRPHPRGRRAVCGVRHHVHEQHPAALALAAAALALAAAAPALSPAAPALAAAALAVPSSAAPTRAQPAQAQPAASQAQAPQPEPPATQAAAQPPAAQAHPRPSAAPHPQAPAQPAPTPAACQAARPRRPAAGPAAGSGARGLREHLLLAAKVREGSGLCRPCSQAFGRALGRLLAPDPARVHSYCRPLHAACLLLPKPREDCSAECACLPGFSTTPCRLAVGGATHLAAYDAGGEEATLLAFALQYCQQRNASFGAAGAVRRGVLPAALGAHAAALFTYSPLTGAVCQGAGCPFIAVLECVPAGARPCAEDEAGNIG